MTIAIAKRLGQALNIRSGSRIKTIDDCMRAYGRAVAQSPTVPLTGSIDASQVISGTFADGLISQSSVTQHEAALNIDWLQLTGVPATFPPSAHNHNASDINAGSMADARIQQSNVTQHQAALALAATQLTSGVLANARVQQSNVTQHQAALNIGWLQLTGVPSTFAPADHLEIGTWTPTDASGAGLALTVYSARYVKHEKLVIAMAVLAYPATASGAQAKLGGLPYAVDANQASRQGFVSYFNGGGATPFVTPDASASTLSLWAPAGGAAYANALMNTAGIHFMAIYTTP